MSAEEAKKEVVAQNSEEPVEKCTTCSPVLLPSPPQEPEKEPQGQGQGQGQSWVLELLDDVRYLISCTNWY